MPGPSPIWPPGQASAGDEAARFRRCRVGQRTRSSEGGTDAVLTGTFPLTSADKQASVVVWDCGADPGNPRVYPLNPIAPINPDPGWSRCLATGSARYCPRTNSGDGPPWRSPGSVGPAASLAVQEREMPVSVVTVGTWCRARRTSAVPVGRPGAQAGRRRSSEIAAAAVDVIEVRGPKGGWR